MLRDSFSVLHDAIERYNGKNRSILEPVYHISPFILVEHAEAVHTKYITRTTCDTGVFVFIHLLFGQYVVDSLENNIYFIFFRVT